jgi:hypothetical protein
MFKNNSWSLVLFIITCHGCNNKSNLQTVDRMQFDSFEIMYVDFATSTLISIKCDQYENLFSDEYRRVVIKDRSNVKKMIEYMAGVRLVNGSAVDIDTRMKVAFFRDGVKVGELCVNRFDMLHNGKHIEYNTQLRDFLLGFF